MVRVAYQTRNENDGSTRSGAWGQTRPPATFLRRSRRKIGGRAAIPRTTASGAIRSNQDVGGSEASPLLRAPLRRGRPGGLGHLAPEGAGPVRGAPGPGERSLVARLDRGGAAQAVFAHEFAARSDVAEVVAPNVVLVAHWAHLLDGELYATGARLDWATLLRRTFDLDVRECVRCKGRLRVRAVVTAAASTACEQGPAPSPTPCSG